MVGVLPKRSTQGLNREMLPALQLRRLVPLIVLVAAGCGDGFDPLASWPEESAVFEAEVLALVNDQRGKGAVCGSETFEPAPPLVVNELLEAAARLHSYDMYDRGYFSHTNPDGHGPVERMDRAGYEGRSWGENIARGQSTPEAVMQSWMQCAGHCANIMSGRYQEIGIGVYERNWTLKFGRPR